jgi:hypothetical protein
MASGRSKITFRRGARQALSSQLRAIPEVIFHSLELNDHTFFNYDLKSLFEGLNNYEQCIEIAAFSCH